MKGTKCLHISINMVLKMFYIFGLKKKTEKLNKKLVFEVNASCSHHWFNSFPELAS